LVAFISSVKQIHNVKWKEREDR